MSEHAYTATTGRPESPALGRHARHGEPETPSQSGSGRPLAVALACLLAGVATWAVAEFVPVVRAHDARALYELTLLNAPRMDRVGHFFVHLLDVDLFILWGIALIAYAISRARPRVAVAVLAVMALAPFTSEALKPLLAQPHDSVGGVQINAASWPSGHATAALALVLSAVLVAPARVRPVVAIIGAGYALAIAFFLLVLAWHMPSDVLGGFLVASWWTALAVAALRFAERRWPTGKPL